MAEVQHPPAQRELHDIIAAILQTYRIAVWLAFGSLGVGFVLAIVTGEDVHTELGSYGAVLHDLLRFRPEGFFGLGIGFIIFAPIVMLFRATYGFWKIGDRRFVAITLVVASILILSTLISVGH